jgi:hypothetical protein
MAPGTRTSLSRLSGTEVSTYACGGVSLVHSFPTAWPTLVRTSRERDDGLRTACSIEFKSRRLRTPTYLCRARACREGREADRTSRAYLLIDPPSSSFISTTSYSVHVSTLSYCPTTPPHMHCTSPEPTNMGRAQAQADGPRSRRQRRTTGRPRRRTDLDAATRRC